MLSFPTSPSPDTLASPVKNRTRSNSIIFLIIFLPSLIVTAYYDIFDIFISWVRQYDVWYLDEVVSMLILCLLPYLIFLTYRLYQLTVALRQNEATILGLSSQNQLILEAAADGLFGLDGEGKVTFINPSAERMLQQSRSQIMGQHYQKIVLPKTVTSSMELGETNAISATFQDENSHTSQDELFQQGDATPFPVEYTCTPIHKKQRLVGAVVTFRDITQRRATEEKVARLAAALSQTADMTIITDHQGIIQYVNTAFERCSLYSKEDVTNQSVALLKSDQQDPIFYEKMVQVVRRGEIWKDRFITRKKNGDFIHVDVIISPIRDQSGTLTSFVAIVRDVTHEVELGRQLRRSQRLEAVGTLAGGISHDFNNILTAILSYTDLAMDDIPPQSLTYRNLQEVMVAATRARDLIKQLLTFSRRGERTPVPLFLSEPVTEAVKLLKAVLPSNIALHYHRDEEEFQVLADPTRIHQVVMNLCTNAAQAMWEKDGKLEIRLEKAPIENRMEQESVTLATLQGSHHMVLTIRDNGCGIAKHNLDRIYEPFFSTKGTGKGSGLGLSVVHGIVQNHQGIIHVESGEGEGTTFQVYFPRLEIQPATEEQHSGVTVQPGN
ncbi:MAG: PAS domain S-box protein [Magnetococcales bacterium]|nr:PAS domain S-box protein [Magnetococcales bacterium]